MQLLANENFPRLSVEFLRSAGYDVTYVAEDFKSISDEAVMSLAIKQERTILTFDRDYGELIFKHNYRPPNGVIYLRLLNYEPDEPGKIIDQLLKENVQTQNLFVVYDGIALRQRAY